MESIANLFKSITCYNSVSIGKCTISKFLGSTNKEENVNYTFQYQSC